MQKQKALQILAGLNDQTEQQASAPTNVHIISGETGAASEDGKVPVRIDGLVYGPDDSQYVEMDTLGGLEEGETTSILLTGEPGHGMVPLAIGTPGGVDRAGKTAKDYLTEYTTTDDEKGLFVHRKTDDLGSENGVKIDEDVNIVRNGESVANYGEETRIGSENERHILITPEEFQFKDGDNIRAILVAPTSGVEDIMLQLNAGPKGDDGYATDYILRHGGQYSSADQVGSSYIMAMYADETVKDAGVYALASPYIAQVQLIGEEISASLGASIYNASMDNLGFLLSARILLAGGDITIPANGGNQATWSWQGPVIAGSGGRTAASFPDTNYVVSIGKSGNAVVPGFNNVDFMVIGKATDSVTVYGWNSNAYSVTLHVTCIGFNSRYGTRT